MIPDLLQWYVNVSNLNVLLCRGCVRFIQQQHDEPILNNRRNTIRPTNKIASCAYNNNNTFDLLLPFTFVLIDSRHIVETSTHKAYKCTYAETKKATQSKVLGTC
jgi:hypothetical protein